MTQASRIVGVLPGEGVGPEVTDAALCVLSAVDEVGAFGFEVRAGGSIGLEAEARHGRPLTDDVVTFCADVFADGGAILAGAGGGRFVYELRREFDLFWKLSPVVVSDALAGTGGLSAERVRGVEIMVVRENATGIYQGSWTIEGPVGARVAAHTYDCDEADVRRVVEQAARLAAGRMRKLAVVVKSAGLPSVSELWRACAADAAARYGLSYVVLDVDYAAYHLIQHPRELDVLVAPDLFGDVLADLGGVLVGSRGLTYSGNFSGDGAAVYQTNHGAAYDLARSDRANPAGQILSLAMLLRASLGLEEAAELIETALEDVFRRGWRTFDIAGTAVPPLGTQAFADRVADAVRVRARDAA
jgi:3-isopropylmalate dehydrogenase